MLGFEWDSKKAAANLKKHGVSFEQARSVFYDPSGLLRSDPDHEEDEARFVLLGLDMSMRHLVVCHCYRLDDEVIRIIGPEGDRT